MTSKKMKVQVDFSDIDLLIEKLNEANSLADALVSKINLLSNREE